jgi:hypothetical protein
MNALHFLPDSWTSSWHAMRDMRRIARQSDHSGLKLAMSATPFLGGFVASLGFLDGPLPADFLTAVIAVAGILAGFLMSLMLASGKPPALHVDVHAARAIRTRIIYLLWDHTVTLSIFILTLLSACVLLAIPGGTSLATARIVTAICIGLLSAGLFRSLCLLPYQIYELHKFQLDVFVHIAEKHHSDWLRSARDERVE